MAQDTRPSQSLIRVPVDLRTLAFGHSVPIVPDGIECHALMVNDVTTRKLPGLGILFGNTGKAMHFRGIGQRWRFASPENRGISLVLLPTPLSGGNHQPTVAPTGKIEFLVATDKDAAEFALADLDPWAFAMSYAGPIVQTAPAAKVPHIKIVNQGVFGPALVNGQTAAAVHARLTAMYVTSSVAQSIGFQPSGNNTKASLAAQNPGIQGQIGASRRAGADLSGWIPQLQAYLDGTSGASPIATPIALPAATTVLFPLDWELVAPAQDGEIAELDIYGTGVASTLSIQLEWDERDAGGF